jgi:hypothetical protein
MQADFIPQNPSAFVVWFTKFILHLRALSPKYELCSEKIDALLKDHEWVHNWAWVKADTKERENRLNRFFDAARDGENADGRFSMPIHDVSEALAFVPDNVIPGIKDRIRELAACIKSQAHIYSKEDGSLLGILTPEEAGWLEEDYTPDLKFEQLPDYALDVHFRKFGMDAIRLEYRYIWGEWCFGGFLTKSPDVLKIQPRLTGSPEQVEIRAVFWDGKRNFGNWSPVYRLLIAP